MHCSAKQGIGRPGRLLNSKSFNYTVSDLLKYVRVELIDSKPEMKPVVQDKWVFIAASEWIMP
jgi:hypothetical protein